MTVLATIPAPPIGGVMVQIRDELSALQVIMPGVAFDLAYNAAGGAAVRAGPFLTSCVRLALGLDQNFRFVRGDATVVCGPHDTLFVGRGVEHVGLQPGQYISFISDDATTGTVNITPAALQ